MIVTVVLLSAWPQLSPRPMAGHSLVYSARDRSVLLIDGDAAGPRPMYSWTKKGWSAIPGSELPARSLAGVAADDQGNILVHGGAIGTEKADGSMEFKVAADTWRWDGKTWKLVAKTGPAARDHHAMVYDSARERFVLFGGSDADPSGRSKFFGDTWEWEGSSWKLVSESGPGERCHFAMVYDPQRRQTLLAGGFGPGGNDSKTWAWDGSRWKVVATGAPAQRTSPRMAWDSKAQRVLLFGGETGGASPSDTWSWDGRSWKKISEDGPAGRTVHGMAFDVSRGLAIVYGGSAGNDVVGDVWEFDGGKWIEKVERQGAVK